MKPIIKRYELISNITEDILIKNGFKKVELIEKKPNSIYHYYKLLTDDIELNIEINENRDKSFTFDDSENIIVLDNNFCQPYYPFYENEKGFPYLNQVIIEYNKAMDELIKKGILKEQKLEKENNNKRLIKQI